MAATTGVNVYEHGILADADEWGGSLRKLATSEQPLYAHFTRTVFDGSGSSLNHRAVHLANVNGPYATVEYLWESDLRYCMLAALYHLDRVIELYVTNTQLFETLHPIGSAIEGNISDPRVFYELDSFFAAGRRVYEAMRKVLWKHYHGSQRDMWRGIKEALDSTGMIPAAFHRRLLDSWDLHGKKFAEYRDCVAHNDPLNEIGMPCHMHWFGQRWGMTVKLPANPEAKSRRLFDYACGPEALSYCHTVACHLVDLCEALEALPEIRHHLDNPKPTAAKPKAS